MRECELNLVQYEKKENYFNPCHAFKSEFGCFVKCDS